MSLFISSFAPDGNYLIASDTRVSGTRADGYPIIQYDGFHKIRQLNSRSFVFMSGYLSVCQWVVDRYKIGYCDSNAKERLINLCKECASQIDNKSKQEIYDKSGEAMAFFLVQAIDGAIKTGL